MDESSRRRHGSYVTYEEAWRECARIVEESVREIFDHDNSAEKNYALYQLYGLSPWFDPGKDGTAFSAAAHARAFIRKLADLKPFLD